MLVPSHSPGDLSSLAHGSSGYALHGISDLYYEVGLSGLVARHGTAAVGAAMRLCAQRWAADSGNVVPLVRRGK